MLLIACFASVLQILLFCRETDATITWTIPLPPRGPLQTSDVSIRTTHQQLLNGSSEARLKWDFTLSGETLREISWKIGVTTIGGKDSGGSITIQPVSNFREHFGISASDRATLIIYNVTEADEAVFSCDVKTNVRNWIDQIQVYIAVPPKLTNVSSDLQTVNESTNLQLFCEASGKLPPNITWTRVFENGSNSEVLPRGPTLDFPNISSADAGTYRCTADNGAGDAVTHTVRVVVKFSPRIALEEENYVAREGNASLHCQVEGYPLPTITWEPCNAQESVCHNSFLNISNVRTPRANYTCSAVNVMGQASASTSLVIGDKTIYLSVTIITDENCNEGASWRKQIIDETEKIFRNSGYTSSRVLDCRPGSVIVHLVLTFDTVVAEDFVISTFQSAIQIGNGKLGELRVNASSIVGIPPVVTSTIASTTSKTPPESGKNTLVIVLGVLGGILGLVTICGCVICCIRMKKNKESKEVDDKGPRRDQPPGGDRHDGQNNSDYDYAGKPSTLSVPPPKPARQGNDQGVEIPMYAQVDKSKKNPKAPANNYTGGGSPKGRERGELQYSTIDHSNQGGSMPRGPANQLRRPPAHTETHYAELV